ncbi:hypothetical protein [Thermoanaerobacterium sp. DL9XJH110]|jgi:hypothetical protein|uniref:hypothetical protein n=1 Tax=Thermoanaerobacterium sp. DL9XJH110 TaxID=3386643 RepID=UPI003BB7FC0A
MQNQGRTRFTLLAISKLYNTRISMVGVDENRRWVRPMPMYQSDLFRGDEKIFEIFGVTEMSLNDWWGPAPRPEDRFFIRNEQTAPGLVKTLGEVERVRLLRALVDPSVDAIFSRGRTLGLIKPVVKDVNFRRNPYDPASYEARMVFKDMLSNTEHNWMVTDLLWHRIFEDFIRENPGLLSAKLKETRELLNTRESYLVVGLTRLFLEHPGPYGGCWPQILGVIML